jgi:NADH-quinone oxidoreductase subunit C
MSSLELDQRLSPIRNRLTRIEHARDRRVFLGCEADQCVAVSRFLFEDLGLRYVISTGIDGEGCFEVLHHFSDDASGSVVTVKAFVWDRDHPTIDSITPWIPAAEWIEREIHDLLGITFRNHPRPERLILEDDWPEGLYPLRKDAKV